jgi:hypothetical protein
VPDEGVALRHGEEEHGKANDEKWRLGKISWRRRGRWKAERDD